MKKDRKGEVIPQEVAARAVEALKATGISQQEVDAKLSGSTVDELRCLVHPDGDYVA